MSLTPVIEVEDLRKQFDPPNGTMAVDGVSFTVSKGEVFSLLGPNGAGKTTTISMLSCLLRPSGGDARVAGHSVTREPAGVKRAIGVVPQEIALYEELSARENLVFWGRMYGLGGDDLDRRVDEVLDLIGLVDRQKDRIKDYSGGMKRRVNIGVALLHRPEVLYLDEPTVGIDPQSRRAILDGILDLNRQGVTLLYTTHYMEEAQEISDRIGIMDHGRMIALGRQQELVEIVGGQTRVEIAVERDLEKALQVWGAVDGVATAVGTEEGRALLSVSSATTVLPRVFASAQQAGIPITGITVTQPNLETVFLHLTGRALRD